MSDKFCWNEIIFLADVTIIMHYSSSCILEFMIVDSPMPQPSHGYHLLLLNTK